MCKSVASEFFIDFVGVDRFHAAVSWHLFWCDVHWERDILSATLQNIERFTHTLCAARTVEWLHDSHSTHTHTLGMWVSVCALENWKRAKERRRRKQTGINSEVVPWLNNNPAKSTLIVIGWALPWVPALCSSVGTDYKHLLYIDFSFITIFSATNFAHNLRSALGDALLLRCCQREWLELNEFVANWISWKDKHQIPSSVQLSVYCYYDVFVLIPLPVHRLLKTEKKYHKNAFVGRIFAWLCIFTALIACGIIWNHISRVSCHRILFFASCVLRLTSCVGTAMTLSYDSNWVKHVTRIEIRLGTQCACAMCVCAMCVALCWL